LNNLIAEPVLDVVPPAATTNQATDIDQGSSGKSATMGIVAAIISILITAISLLIFFITRRSRQKRARRAAAERKILTRRMSLISTPLSLAKDNLGKEGKEMEEVVVFGTPPTTVSLLRQLKNLSRLLSHC
jgi:hypothetical protein